MSAVCGTCGGPVSGAGSPCPSCLLRIAVKVKPGENSGGMADPTVEGYEIVDEIGSGGMGIVYLAEQAEPVRRFVALKVIKPGMDTRRVLAGFQEEKQTLLLMDHPGIAQVFDAGATREGRPYFVMEWIDGGDLNAYCEEQNSGLRERLGLFLQICSAVQHAHTKGVIHCDLKPSNILVIPPREGQAAQVKVIDFGIARAVDPEAKHGREATILDGSEHYAGTPAYMAPEQRDGGQGGIDTRADIFSLGAILYELISGRSPDEKGGLPGAVRLHGKGAADLDWITAKAMEPDRERRYVSVQGLAEDVESFLKHQPVRARPPSRWYEFQKFARRHRVGLTVALSTGVAILAFGGIALRQAVRASKAEAHAVERREQGEALITFMLDDLYGSLKPIGKLPLLEGVIDRADAYFESMSPDEAALPENVLWRASVLSKSGWMQVQKGKHSRGIELTRDALNLLDGLVERGIGTREVRFRQAAYAGDLALFLRRNGKAEESIAVFHEAIGKLERILAGNPEDPEEYSSILAGIRNTLGSTYLMLGDDEKALLEYETAFAIRKDMLAKSPGNPERLNDVAKLESDIGRIHERLENYGEALKYARRALEIREKLPGMRPNEGKWRARLAESHHMMARLYKRIGGDDFDLGFEHVEKSVAIWRQLTGAEPFNFWWKLQYATSLNQQVSLAVQSHRLERGMEAGILSCELWRELVENDPKNPRMRQDCAYALSNFARVLEGLGHFKKAEEFFLESLAEAPENKIAVNGLDRVRRQLSAKSP